MKIGIIGLEIVGEGMSRRLVEANHEVWGYRDDYEKACEQYDAGYISGCTTSIQTLVYVIHSNKTVGLIPGVFLLTIKEKIDELLQFCVEGDIIIDYCNSDSENFREREQQMSKLGIQYINCNLSNDIHSVERGYNFVVTGADYAVSLCSPIFKCLLPVVPNDTNTYVNKSIIDIR